MKKFINYISSLFILIFGILIWNSATAQVKMQQGLITNDQGMFIVVGNEVKGSYHVYDQIEYLDSLQDFYTARAQKGMLVTIIDADNAESGEQTKTYMLADNSVLPWEWKEVSLSFVEGTLQSDTVLCDAVVINGDTILDIAQVGDVISDSTNIATSVGYVHSAISNGAPEIVFDGNRNITRDISVGNTSLKGQNLNAENIAEFLEAVFFPKSAPSIDSLKYAGSETPTIAYSDWSTWTPKNDIQLDWQITNISKSIDGLTGAEYDVTSILLQNDDSGSDVTGAPNTFSTNDQVGTFSGVTINTTGLDAKAGQTKTLSMRVEDAQGSASTRDIAFTLSPAVQHALNSVTPSSTLLERNGSAKSVNVAISITTNDESITSLVVDGNSVAIPASFTSQSALPVAENVAVSIAHVDDVSAVPAGAYASKKDIIISSTGGIYNAAQSLTAASVYLVDKAYAGYAIDPATMTDSDFKLFTSTQLRTNPYGMLSNNDNGIALSNTYGDNYHLVFAIPSYGNSTKTFKIETFDVGNWNTDASSVTRLVTYTNGSLTTQYYLVYSSNLYNSGKSVTARIIAQ